MSVNKVEERIRQALRQIKSHVQHATDCGLIAISITRTVNSGGVIWEVESEAEIEEFLNGRMQGVISRFDPLLQAVSNTSVNAVVFYMTTPIHVPGQGFWPVERGMVYQIPAVTDVLYLERLTAMLRT